jgi:hypothetical protein
MVLIPTVINATSPYYHSIRGASEGLVEGGAGADYNNNGIYFFIEVTNKHTWNNLECHTIAMASWIFSGSKSSQ